LGRLAEVQGQFTDKSDSVSRHASSRIRDRGLLHDAQAPGHHVAKRSVARWL
jgi:hypothetical protein